MNEQKGLFITLEGGEGSGKTTLSKRMKEELEKLGVEVVCTREPGGVPEAEAIRGLIMGKELDSTTNALLFAAARREHLLKKVLPALERGAIVICDRYIHSSLVYQGIVGGVGVSEVFEINRVAIQGVLPDLTLYLDIEPALGIERIHSNSNREINHFDEKPFTYHESVREGYRALPFLYPGHSFVEIDASGNEETVLRNAMDKLNGLIKATVAV